MGHWDILRDEIDPDGATCALPAERMKASREHPAPLSDRARPREAARTPARDRLVRRVERTHTNGSRAGTQDRYVGGHRRLRQVCPAEGGVGREEARGRLTPAPRRGLLGRRSLHEISEPTCRVVRPRRGAVQKPDSDRGVRTSVGGRVAASFGAARRGLRRRTFGHRQSSVACRSFWRRACLEHVRLRLDSCGMVFADSDNGLVSDGRFRPTVKTSAKSIPEREVLP